MALYSIDKNHYQTVRSKSSGPDRYLSESIDFAFNIAGEAALLNEVEWQSDARQMLVWAP